MAQRPRSTCLKNKTPRLPTPHGFKRTAYYNRPATTTVLRTTTRRTLLSYSKTNLLRLQQPDYYCNDLKVLTVTTTLLQLLCYNYSATTTLLQLQLLQLQLQLQLLLLLLLLLLLQPYSPTITNLLLLQQPD